MRGRKSFVGLVAFVLYASMPVMANLAIARYGLVPVGFGLLAPAGVYFAGVALGLRDLVQHVLGKRWAVGAILVGAVVSYLFTPQFAIASGLAFLGSELLDFMVYTPLRERNRPYLAVALSNTVGLLVDTVVFLTIAFRSLDFFWGQVVGKTEMTILALVLLFLYRTVMHHDNLVTE